MELRGTMGINGRGHLEIGGCDVVDLAARFGTPLYVFDEELIRGQCRAYQKAFARHYPHSRTIYAGKAFLTLAMCRLIAQEGLCLDVVSGGELYTALAADFPRERIYFHGNNKSREELVMALQAGIGCIVVDNSFELEILDRLCEKLGRQVDILLRVTPGVEAHTHTYIQTGQLDSKFGFPLAQGIAREAVRTALEARNLNLRGLHCHIGSQIFELESFGVTIGILYHFLKEIRDELGWTAAELNLGGGLGIKYSRDDSPISPEEYIAYLVESVRENAAMCRLDLPLISVEPGRSIVGEAGTTLYRVGAVKELPGIRKYITVDGGMGDNPRVALYQAVYEAMVANKADKQKTQLVSVAGKCCESGDMLIWDLEAPEVAPGDILAVFCTGAYTYSMASNYNRLPRPAVVFVSQGSADLVVRRETYATLIANDVIPFRLESLEARSVEQA
ncbi:MAG: diaminopimelate decarboxylase [Firmicutes bacterium]|jgi:diaminopimelate decarboxylase|nr:diaminopimelate decarboxylase [Bacillota bacterium]